MEGNIHFLKTLQPYFDDVEIHAKNFEIRRDDRFPAFEVGDTLVLEEFDGANLTGRKVQRTVTYIFRGGDNFGLMKGYCILGID